MKRFRQLCAATVLTLTFAFATFAGDMQFPGIASQPPSTDISQSSTDSSDLTITTLIVLTIVEAISLP